MKILVFVKQVPDTDDVKLDPKTGNIMREGVASKLNPLDANAVEAAIQLKEKYGVDGYLHWGWNQFVGVPNPFERTACRNTTGIGTDFPCGDAFIVYPGEDGPWISLRFEAERRGAEEACLLKALREKDPQAHDALIARVFTGFSEYNDDPALLEQVHEELLRLLSE